MATPDFTLGSNPNAGATMAQLAAQQGVERGHAQTDAAMQQGFLTDTYTNRTVPQLQSGIASAGQWYGTARQKSEKNSYQDFLKGSYDVQSGLSRHLDELDRQRVYAAMGLII